MQPIKIRKPNPPKVHPSAARPSSLKTRRFPPPPHEGFGFIGIKFFITEFFLWKAFKTFKSERRFEISNGTDFQDENSKLYRRTFKGLSPSTTPFGKRKFCQGRTFSTTQNESFVKSKMSL
jgi:hypothetical protein